MTFSCSIALRNKTVADTFLPSSNNANGRLSQEVMLRSKFCYHCNVTSHYSPLHSLKTWMTREQNMQVSR